MCKVAWNLICGSEDPFKFQWGSMYVITFSGPNGGSIEPFGVRESLFRGSIEHFGAFDGTFWDGRRFQGTVLNSF